LGKGIYLSQSPLYFLNSSEYDHRCIYLAKVVIGKNYTFNSAQWKQQSDQIYIEGEDAYFIPEAKRILFLYKFRVAQDD
jgi:hypothetical protein